MEAVVDQKASKKRRTMEEGNSINERLLKLEEAIISIQAKIAKTPATRKNTLSDLDAKLNTVLDILSKVVAAE